MNPATLCSRCKNPMFQPRVDVDSSESYITQYSGYDSSRLNPDEVKEMVLFLDKDFEDYEAEVTRLQAQIAHVRVQQERLTGLRTRMWSLLSPFRRIPNEILGLIFEFACAQNVLQKYSRYRPVIADSPVFAVSAVCHRWRELAISSSVLWSNLKLVEIPSDAEASAFHNALSLCLQRSRTSPLALNVNLELYPKKHDVTMNTLCKHARRWRSFRLYGAQLYEIHSFRTEPRLEFPILEALEMIPRLTEPLYTTDIYLLEQVLNQLVSIDMFVEIYLVDTPLDSYSNLRTLVLWFHPDWLFGLLPGRAPPRRLDKLTSLALRVYDDPSYDGEDSDDPHESIRISVVDTIFSSFTLPSLSELCLNGPDELIPHPWPESSFRSFLSRSSCSLSTLTLNGIPISDLELISAIQSLPTLLELVVSDTRLPPTSSPITRRFISSLRAFGGRKNSKAGSNSDPESGRSSPTLVPKLRSISLKYGGKDFDDAAFVDMVSSRWLPDLEHAAVVGIECLRSVVIRFRAREVDEEVYQTLEDLDRMGLRFVVTGVELTESSLCVGSSETECG